MQGGGLQFSSANTYDYTTSGRLQLADGTNGIIDDGGQTVTFANAIGLGAAKTGALIKQGVGTLTLNPGAGNTNSMGSLAVQAGNVTLSSGTLNVTTGGTATTSSTGPRPDHLRRHADHRRRDEQYFDCVEHPSWRHADPLQRHLQQRWTNLQRLRLYGND